MLIQICLLVGTSMMYIATNLLFCRDVSKAAELALQTKSLSDLDQVLKKCGAEHRALAEQLRVAMSQSQKR